MSTASLPATADPAPGPHHVAIIMDGNGRWAKARGLPRVAGHRRGADAVRRVVRGAGELGIPVLTLFAFSTENWTRPADEVNDLMGLLRHYLRNELEELHKNGARLRVIGNRDGLAADIVRDIADAEKMTRANGRIDVNICINYGARDEILQATRNLARRSPPASSRPSGIDEARFEQELLTAGVPDPGPADPHQRRAAHQQFPALAVCLCRAGVRRHAVAGFRQGPSGTGDRRVPSA